MKLTDFYSKIHLDFLKSKKIGLIGLSFIKYIVKNNSGEKYYANGIGFYCTNTNRKTEVKQIGFKNPIDS